MKLVRAVGTTMAWTITALVFGSLAAPGGLLPFSRVALDRPALAISGQVSGIQPGVPSPLVLTLRNQSSSDAVVRRVTARAVSSSSAGCPVEALGVERWQGALRVPAGGSAEARLRLLLAPDATGCAGVTWQLSYASS